jgi:3-oxoacyl-[acyl-carrier-protein] synthase-3
MARTEFIATGFYVPPRVVTNDDLSALMDTSDEWITQRTGIKERRWVEPGTTCSSLAAEATFRALEQAGLKAEDLDCIIFATASPDHFFPGNGCFLQRLLGVTDIPALDVRDQCTGFLYGLSVADAWVRCGQYKRVLLVGAEIQSPGLDATTEGRDTAVIFGDGAGVAILGPTNDPKRGVLSTHLFSDGRQAEKLWMDGPGLSHVPWISAAMLADGKARIKMEGREVFKHATTKMPESVNLALQANGCTMSDVKLLIAHQANLRISEMVQRQLELRDDQIFNNIQKYGNTTAASIPIALHEAVCDGRLERGELLILTAFGSGFTWGSAAVRW